MTDDTEAYIAITRLQSAYADVVTRRAWQELADLFLPNCPIFVDTITRPPIELSGSDELAAFIRTALERFDFFEFVILNTVVDVTSDSTARARFYIEEVRHEAGSDSWSNAFGLYQDSYVKQDDRWLFAERRYRSLARKTADGTEVFSGTDWLGRQ